MVSVLSLGFMVLGIGSITWAMFSIRTQSSYYSPDNTISTYSVPAIIEVEQRNLTGDNLAPMKLSYSSTSTTPEKILYPVYPEEGDNIGSLTIPVLKIKLAIFQGTGPKELKKGVGHFNQSVLPGEEDNCVISGHRETGFRKLGKLKIGDLMIVKTSAGTFTYKVKGTRIVHADDKTVIVPTDNAVLTLTTCYPFNTPGYFPDRYIVSGELVISK